MLAKSFAGVVACNEDGNPLDKHYEPFSSDQSTIIGTN